MATSRRDVTLGLNVEVNGANQVDALAGEFQQLSSATETARKAEAAATAEQRAARQVVDERVTALQRLRAESTPAIRATAEYAETERRLRISLVDAREALRQKSAATATAAAASREAVTAERAIADQLARVKNEYREVAAAAALAARQQREGAASVRGPLETLQGQLTAVRNVAALALGGSIAGGLARDLAATADSAANLRARLGLIVGTGPELEATFQAVLDVAQRTGSALETTGNLYARIATAGREFNLSQADALRLTESIGQAVAVSGAAASSSDAALTQLIQGLQSGVLRGEEFNSVLEQAPRLAQALADGIGVTTGELRALANQGALTTEVVIAALQGQSATLQREFDALPLTVGRAIQNLSTAWTAYVAQADAATGASSTAASAINLLAGNLDTLGAVLLSAGKIAAAYAAIGLAKSFIETRTAVAAATVAVAANTAATAANTAAQAANAAATAGTVANAGRLASVLGSIKVFALISVLTNLREIGTALGEGAAKLVGYKDRSEELEAQQRATEAATRANATATAALAQASQRAAEQAAGLTKEAKGIVGEFEALTKKGETTADALDKVSKSLNLSDIGGIATAGAALDVLAQRGRITADTLRDTLGAALKGEDLGRFEAQARAAFDSSEQGARRLAAALEALAEESLRRAGTSTRELATGFNEASVSAINDLDALARTLTDIKAPADEAGRALQSGLDKAVAAASTQRAVEAVIQRIEELGRAGLLTGTQLTTALESARTKLDSLRPGINSLEEALRTLGVKTRTELQDTADKLGEAYAQAAASGQLSLQQQVEAYGRWRTAALAASGGVETGQLQLQRIVLENRGAVIGLGDAFEGSMGRARSATRGQIEELERLTQAARTAAGALVSGSTGLGGIGGPRDALRGPGDGLTGRPPNQLTPQRDAAGQINIPPGFLFDAEAYSRAVTNYRGPFSVDPAQFMYRPAGFAPGAGGNPNNLRPGGAGNFGAPPPAPAPSPPNTATPSAAPPPVAVRYDVTLPGGASLYANTQAQADRFMQELERSFRASGGGTF